MNDNSSRHSYDLNLGKRGTARHPLPAIIMVRAAEAGNRPAAE
jgi:hypothetical protein